MQEKGTAFYLVDDDRSIRRILANIIEENELGEVIGEAENGKQAEKEILALKPDIAIIDLLLPFQDGIQTIANLRMHQDLNCNFIAISQVNDKEMVAKAYKAGIEFFIHKPLNVIEIITVVKKVQELKFLKETFNNISAAVKHYMKKEIQNISGTEELEKKIKGVLAELGILGEMGARDIINLLGLIWKKEIDLSSTTLAEVYEKLSQLYESRNKIKIEAKAIEMRMRRAMAKALSNIALRAIEDYGDEYFIRYGHVLFDYGDIKTEMDYFRKKTSNRGKINVKKFLEGLLWIIEENSF
ncbi:two-component system response regulator YcbB [Caldanaerobacter subterraneus subsp. tengcongensis MB4]|uniref:Stage 0 sporulation protein A homolog n=1 Tax=Caldanaerobacter subterraneus subsp. tengcongensis (strain DSM 15242 / JCM 11007 / NBRC 100824 / MB4) TaxID=273068 RepID=Q8RAL0_CALS4|nr:response regulator [Caldanaerobacter subterraneus]AAM24433.1 CheY-like receiver domains [Caldanaerobacter subterraneus subsp. tengcongensis MB4]MBE3579658.1 response regulator [Caldanaerobacter subterraneus]MCS3916010.1 two-component system response regulator YcbB [Caldanaerobacter subterraneus subsp. tengcongensis MB4]